MKWLCSWVFIFILNGCSSPTRIWEGVDRSMVWTAMVAVAESPEYKSSDPRKRWFVTQNNVVADAQSGSIEIHRTLRRSFQLPRQREQTDFREYFIEITLHPTHPTQTTFDLLNKQLIPVRSQEEADRFFSQVDSLLSLP